MDHYSPEKVKITVKTFFISSGIGKRAALRYYKYVTELSEGSKTARFVSKKPRQSGFSYRMFPRFKPIDAIEYDARFPVCELSYKEDALPVSVTLKAVAPFVPHDDDISSTPGFILDFCVENTSDGACVIDLLSGSLEGWKVTCGDRTAHIK